ncbi:hypothetical protein L226DRAFT_83696 [Lentinus tigrinus ALCF2SS1-7]|uniref:Mid2 domain-containing protein n=1 Tax=Lentinus tigrinus ALCF2SS1-6 TaxID=1328759 RepID=A0A5C2RVZ2_9APHY|nr:hypothetical protein L227DRAFT_615789 [Lentinus tigrinus ALCF2SS1-6]RPD74147.1 hypothetical protein L226DRAFT_83696 [Lentinus tigrinus ALCF2SS1-7]
MASHLYGFQVRRSGPRDFFQPGDFNLIPLPSPLSKPDNGKDSDSDDNSAGDGGNGGNSDSDSHGGGDNGQSKLNNNQQDDKQDGHSDGSDKQNNSDDDESTPSSGTFPCPANSSPNPPFPGCFTVNDGGPFFKYIGSWMVSSLDGNGKGSIHQATARGAALEISVDGTGFALFGIIPPSNTTDLPPSALYTVDNSTSRSTASTLPFATDCQRNQNFFQVNNLTPGNHTITVNVTHASPTAPYIVDYIWICGVSTHGKSTSSAVAAPSTTAGASSDSPVSKTHSTRSRDAIIVGTVLGGIILLLVLTFLACVCIRRRRRRQNRLRGLHLAASPVASWLRSQSGSRETGTVFTSTESIMRDNPTYSSSADTKDLEKARRDIVSMPPSVRFSSTTRTFTRPPSSQPPGVRSSVQRANVELTAITTT